MKKQVIYLNFSNSKTQQKILFNEIKFAQYPDKNLSKI